MATVHLTSRDVNYAQDLQVGKHHLVADEGPSLGGQDAGPGPYSYVLAGLAACTSITLKMYAQRKGWDIGQLHVDVSFVRHGDEESIERTVRVGPAVTQEQRARLAEITEKTPVTKTLKRGTPIITRFE